MSTKIERNSSAFYALRPPLGMPIGFGSHAADLECTRCGKETSFSRFRVETSKRENNDHLSRAIVII